MLSLAVIGYLELVLACIFLLFRTNARNIYAPIRVTLNLVSFRVKARSGRLSGGFPSLRSLAPHCDAIEAPFGGLMGPLFAFADAAVLPTWFAFFLLFKFGYSDDADRQTLLFRHVQRRPWRS